MRYELMREVEASLDTIKAGIFTASSGANKLASLESEAVDSGASPETVETIRGALDKVAREIRQLKKAELILHQYITRAAPKEPSGGPVVFIGT
jgi:hypothetical protein